MPSKKSSDELIDWAVVRQRLKTAMDATAGRWEPSADARQRKLETVAKAFTRPHERSGVPAIGSILFDLDGRRCAIEARYVSEIVPLTQITPLPRTPEFVIGLYNLRGHLLPVFDLRRVMEPAKPVPFSPAWAIVCGDEQPEFLIATSAMAGAASDLPDASHPREDGAAAWVRGETSDGTVVLDGEALLADRLLFLEEPGNAGFPDGKEGGE